MLKKTKSGRKLDCMRLPRLKRRKIKLGSSRRIGLGRSKRLRRRRWRR